MVNNIKLGKDKMEIILPLDIPKGENISRDTAIALTSDRGKKTV